MACPFNPASEEYADLIVPHNNLSPQEIMNGLQVECLDYANPEFAVIYLPLSELEPITVEKYTYTAIPKLYTLLDTTSMEASGILKTFNQPNLGYRGEGVIIGFIDTGIDYRNPLFKNPDGTTRILGIWDQTLPPDNGRMPMAVSSNASRSLIFEQQRYSATLTYGLSYGQEYVKEDIDAALASDAPLSLVPSVDDDGHGTFMAGIAAGNTSESLDFTGAAPDCMIGVVKLKPAKQYLRDFYCILPTAVAYQENDIMLGIKYLQQLAARHQKPLVIYIGLGTNYGSHDGTSPLGLSLQGLGRLTGICSVLPAGNEAGLGHHYLGHALPDVEYDDVEIRVAPGEKGFVTELWALEPELYTVGFVSPTGEVISRLSISLGAEIRIPFYLDSTVITVNYRTTEIGSGSQFILMRFETPSPGIWHIRVYNSLYITGIYHMWLPIQGFIKDNTVFLRPEPDTTVTEPANAASPITVSTYDHVTGAIYIHSSRGYSRSGVINPDLAAPGVNVYGPGRSPASDPNSFPMTRRTGSSVAAAHVAGAAADLFSWGITSRNQLYLSDTSVRAYLIRGAERNPARTYPNREFGYGTLDLYQVFTRMRE